MSIISKKYLILLSITIGFISGCGSSSNETESDSLFKNVYFEKSGDTFTSLFDMNISYSNGQTTEVSFTEVKTYSQVNEIPEKYNYSNLISGPYLLKTTTNNGELDSLEYESLDGDSIIDDNLKEFTNIEFTSKSGSEDPSEINIGDVFSYYQNASLFDSETGVEIGYKITESEFSVIGTELLTTSAGAFNTIKIDYILSQDTSQNDVIDTLSGNGSAWFDISNGYLVQTTLEGNATLNKLDLSATFISTITLKSFSLASNENEIQISMLNKKENLPNKEIIMTNFLKAAHHF